MRRLWSWLAAKVASVFTDPVYLSDEEQFEKCFGLTGKDVGRFGSTVIIRSYKDFMFHVVDIAAEGGPELVGEYSIYRNAVIGAECWELRKRSFAMSALQNENTQK